VLLSGEFRWDARSAWNVRTAIKIIAPSRMQEMGKRRKGTQKASPEFLPRRDRGGLSVPTTDSSPSKSGLAIFMGVTVEQTNRHLYHQWLMSTVGCNAGRQLPGRRLGTSNTDVKRKLKSPQYFTDKWGIQR
jgi:hypothetical protein